MLYGWGSEDEKIEFVYHSSDSSVPDARELRAVPAHEPPATVERDGKLFRFVHRELVAHTGRETHLRYLYQD